MSEGAGLYLLDRKVGLCLAYQPPARRKLRPGDQVEVSAAAECWLVPDLRSDPWPSVLRSPAASGPLPVPAKPRLPSQHALLLPRLLPQGVGLQPGGRSLQRARLPWRWSVATVTAAEQQRSGPVPLDLQPGLPAGPQVMVLVWTGPTSFQPVYWVLQGSTRFWRFLCLK